MIKYELKKLFFNRFVAALLVIITTFTVVTACITCYDARVKAVYQADPILYKKGVLTRTFVNQDNIGELIARYNELINDDSNYDFVDTSKRSSSRYLYGKNADEVDKKMEELYAPYEGGVTPPEVMEKIKHWASYQLSDDAYPEAAALYYIISDFTYKQTNLYPDMYKGTIWYNKMPDNQDTDPYYNEGYDKRAHYIVETGVTYDRNFGWEHIVGVGNNMGPLIIAAAVALASVILFTGEYSNKTDVLIMSSGRGRKRAVSSKIIAGGIFSAAVTVYYLLLLLFFYGILFSLDGGTSDSLLFINGRMYTYAECFGIMVGSLIICNLAITMTALAVSSFCTKTIPSVLLSFLFVLVPFIIPFAVYFEGNFANILNCLPVNAILIDYGYSWYDVYTVGGTSVIESHVLFAPLAAAQLLISLPFVWAGWKKHKILN